jgi:hypothetical protein
LHDSLGRNPKLSGTWPVTSNGQGSQLRGAPMTLYVLNTAMSIVDEKALATSARAANLSPEDREKVRLDTDSPAVVQRAHDLEAVVSNALKAAGCHVDWVRVDCVGSPGTDSNDDLDVAFLSEDETS